MWVLNQNRNMIVKVNKVYVADRPDGSGHSIIVNGKDEVGTFNTMEIAFLVFQDIINNIAEKEHKYKRDYIHDDVNNRINNIFTIPKDTYK